MLPDDSEPAVTARKPHRIFDRPKHPHDWRWVVGGVGKVLIVTGLLMFAFVAYQLWGTGIHTAQAQNRLERQFRELADDTVPTVSATTTTSTTTTTIVGTTVPGGTTTDPSTTDPGTTTSTIETAPFQYPVPVIGAPLVKIDIPRIDVHFTVIEGVGVKQLKDGPGHFPESVLPGQLGNAAFAGHRTTYGHPFYDVDKLQPGDEISFTYPRGERFVYLVTSTEIVRAGDYDKVVPTVDPSIATVALSSCHPIGTANKRIIIHGRLQLETSPPIIAPLPTTTTSTVPSTGGTTAPGVTDPTATLPDEVIDPDDGVSEDAFAQGWFADSGAWLHVVAWGVLLGLAFYGAYRLAKGTRRIWLGTVVGIAPIVVLLYFWFENVSRLLPPGL